MKIKKTNLKIAIGIALFLMIVIPIITMSNLGQQEDYTGQGKEKVQEPIKQDKEVKEYESNSTDDYFSLVETISNTLPILVIVTIVLTFIPIFIRLIRGSGF